MTTKYTPKYDQDAINAESDTTHWHTGTSARQNVTIEEANQRAVGEKWMLAREVMRGNPNDSRTGLEALGFVVTASDDELFYNVTPPAGWTKTTDGYWTSVKDSDGNERLSMFYKGAWYDRRAHVFFTE